MDSRRALFAFALVVCELLFTPSMSWAIPLADLFQGATITADDKLFNNFTLTTSETNNGGVINTTQIDVTPLAGDPLNPGIKFTAPVGALGTPFGHTGASNIRLVFGFDVSTTNGLALIKDNSLLINGFTFDSGPLASIQVSEQIFDASGALLGTKIAIANNQSDVGDPSLFDSLDFSPRSFVHVVKQIDIIGPGDNDGAFLTMFEQRFSQIIPEPSGLLLAGILVVIGVASRRRRR